jgi:putative heme iron utilization protein
MKEASAARAAELLRACRVAAVGTVRNGAPALSLVPYAIGIEPLAFIVLVSALAAHTKEMRAEPRVALLVSEPETGVVTAHALARVALAGEARPIAPADPAYATMRAHYETRFPDMAMLFGLGDFTLFAIEPTAVRAVTGFAQAHSLTPAALARALAAN